MHDTQILIKLPKALRTAIRKHVGAASASNWIRELIERELSLYEALDRSTRRVRKVAK